MIEGTASAGIRMASITGHNANMTGEIINTGTIRGLNGIYLSGGSDIVGGITNNTGGIIEGTGTGTNDKAIRVSNLE